MELETKKVSRFGKKFWFKAIAVFIGLMIFYGIGNSSAKVDLGKEKVNYDKLVKEIKSKKQEVKDIQGKLDDINKQYSDKKSEFEEAMKVVDNKKAAEGELAKVNDTVKTKQDQVKSLDSQIGSKQKELASINGEIKAKKDAPKVLSAGQYVVGKDVPVSRYKAAPNGSGSNFVVHGSDGDLKVNTILGDHSGLGTAEYVFWAEKGDIIETEASVKLIPVE
jgi:ribosomal protein S13